MSERLMMTMKAREAAELLIETPHEEEINEAITRMKESAPGKDGVRLCYIRRHLQKLERSW